MSFFVKENIESTPNNPSIELEDTSNFSGQLEESYALNDVDISSRRIKLEVLIDRMQGDEINLETGLQRKANLWNQTQQSKFIESILIRFPLPVFCFDGSEENNWLIIDGLQRLSTLHSFIIEKSFTLINLEFLEKFNGFPFQNLPRDLQRRILETEVPVYLINPGTPKNVKFSIFKRINTGGIQLNPQEIRHALNQGIAADFVKELAEFDDFIKATGSALKSERMEDREFVTRFLAFYINSPEDYKPELDTFLNNTMLEIPKLSPTKRLEVKQAFLQAMSLAYEIFGEDAFRKRFKPDAGRNPINKALFESWAVNFAQLNNEEETILRSKKEQLKINFWEKLNTDEDFVKSITSGTGDKKNVLKRFNTIQEIIQKTI